MVKEFSSYDNPPILRYEELDSEKIFIGCNIKSRYDEERIEIKEQNNPKRILFRGHFLYGALLDIDEKYLNVVENIKKYEKIDLYVYNKILLENNLSCNENFSYFENGLYPIDLKHISNFIDNFKYNDFFDDDPQMPIYQRIKGLNVFILIP